MIDLLEANFGYLPSGLNPGFANNYTQACSQQDIGESKFFWATFRITREPRQMDAALCPIEWPRFKDMEHSYDHQVSLSNPLTSYWCFVVIDSMEVQPRTVSLFIFVNRSS